MIDRGVLHFWIILSLGMAFLIRPIRSLSRYARLHHGGTETETRVESVEKRKNGRNMIYTALLQYTVEGREYAVSYQMVNKRPWFQQGDRLVVLRDPENAENILMEGDKSALMGSFLSIACGIVLLIGAWNLRP